MNSLILAMVVMAGGDTLELRDSSEGNIAELLYQNVDGQESTPGHYKLKHVNPDGVEVSIHVILAFEANSVREIITVLVDGDLYVAMPESIAVADGEETIVQILAPMF